MNTNITKKDYPNPKLVYYYCRSNWKATLKIVNEACKLDTVTDNLQMNWKDLTKKIVYQYIHFHHYCPVTDPHFIITCQLRQTILPRMGQRKIHLTPLLTSCASCFAFTLMHQHKLMGKHSKNISTKTQSKTWFFVSFQDFFLAIKNLIFFQYGRWLWDKILQNISTNWSIKC